VELPPKGDSELDDEQYAIEKDKEKTITPQVLILSSGEISSFQIALYAKEQPTWRVIGDIGGNFMTQPLDQR